MVPDARAGMLGAACGFLGDSCGQAELARRDADAHRDLGQGEIMVGVQKLLRPRDAARDVVDAEVDSRGRLRQPVVPQAAGRPRRAVGPGQELQLPPAGPTSMWRWYRT